MMESTATEADLALFFAVQTGTRSTSDIITNAMGRRDAGSEKARATTSHATKDCQHTRRGEPAIRNLVPDSCSQQLANCSAGYRRRADGCCCLLLTSTVFGSAASRHFKIR